jgi:hypothetical protein
VQETSRLSPISLDFPEATFRHRASTIETLPVGLTDAFSTDPARQKQWVAFLR